MQTRTDNHVVVRTPVALDAAVLEALRAKLAVSLAADIDIEVKIDLSLRGAVIVLDEGHQIRIDPAMPLAELQRRLAEASVETDHVSDRGAAVHQAISDYEAGTLAALGPTNLRRALAESKVRRMTLVTRTPVDQGVVDRLRAKLTGAAECDIELSAQVDPRMEDGAVLKLGEDRRIVLDGRYRLVSALERAATDAREQVSTEESSPDPSELIRAMLAATMPELAVEELLDTGTVLEVGDGVAKTSGLRGVGSQELVEFDGGVFGLAFSLNRDQVGCILLGAEEGLREGGRVTRTGHLLRVPAGEEMLGRIVNSLGQPIDGKGPVNTSAFMPAERVAAGVVDRQPVNTPLHTGIKVIDALVPLGRGQRELIIGDRKIGKTTVAIDTILSQKGQDVVCVYAAIGQKASTVASVVRTLEARGAMEYTIVVVSLPGEQPAFRYLTPYTACAIGEYFMEGSQDALVIYDDLTKHAVTYREMSALLERPVGREAYPGDIFYVHSRLLERAAHLSDEFGGGSLTALPIVETQAGDISAFIPTNVVSICDGQIFLDTDLFNEGVRPALDVGLSVSRVGGSAQTKTMKRVAGRLRIDLAQYHEMAQFVKFGAEVDSATHRQLTRGERSRELLKQGAHTPLATGLEVASLFAATEGHLDDVAVDAVGRFESGLHAWLMEHDPNLVERLGSAEELDDAVRVELVSAIERFAASGW